MASSFEGDLFGATAQGVLASIHGEAVSYTPSGGQASSVTAIFDRGRCIDPKFTDTRGRRAFGVLTVPTGAISAWTPSTSDTATIAGVTYAVTFVGDLEPAVKLQLVQTGGSST